VRAMKTHGEIGTAFQKLNASVIRWQGKKPRRQGSGMLREWTALNAAHPPTGLFSTHCPHALTLRTWDRLDSSPFQRRSTLAFAEDSCRWRLATLP
jgi:hypothetical protein